MHKVRPSHTGLVVIIKAVLLVLVAVVFWYVVVILEYSVDLQCRVSGKLKSRRAALLSSCFGRRVRIVRL